MFCAPVTYDADARQLWFPCQSAAQFSDRYVRPAMPPLSAQPRAQFSTTRTMSRVGLPGISDPPQRLKYVPTPASSSRRLVTVDVHVTCCTRCPYGARYVPVSGALVALADGLDEA